ncbi:hypothetical protein, partial [Escherichia coli]|uniref:hypothetical protein n=1 Tax=Escherichia coli TaxID=562 RepID=UPI001BAEA29D
INLIKTREQNNNARKIHFQIEIFKIYIIQKKSFSFYLSKQSYLFFSAKIDCQDSNYLKPKDKYFSRIRFYSV